MIERARTFLIRLFGGWTDFIGHHSFLVLFLSLLATVGAVTYTVNHFRIDTEMADMISDKLPYRKLEKEFQSAFPQFKETIVVVIDREGKIQKSWFERKSGNSLFDQRAMRAIKKAEPLPPIPKEFSDATLEMGFRFHPD